MIDAQPLIRTNIRYALVLLFLINTQCTTSENRSAYLMSYFKDNTSGMFLATSDDGYTWQVANNGEAVVQPELGTHMRDPSILKGKDGRWHVAFGTQQGKGGNTIGYMWSEDLLNWQGQRTFPIERGPLAKGVINAWAPELFYDEQSELYYFIWTSSTRQVPGLQSYLKGNQRCWYATTRDFQTISQPKLLLTPQPNAWIIDADLFWVDEKEQYYSFFKVESDDTLTGGKTGIHYATAERIEGPWNPMAPAASEFIYEGADKNDEGPNPVRIGEHLVVYFDRGVIRSKDLENWEMVTDEVTWPEGFKHGTVIQVQESDIRTLVDGR
ncbi:MAG: family 43 glycosylhydrolase [Bacteroidota bacterium]